MESDWITIDSARAEAWCILDNMFETEGEAAQADMLLTALAVLQAAKSAAERIIIDAHKGADEGRRTNVRDGGQ